MPNPDSPPTQATHAIMFWLLTAMAMAVFAPCVLVPVWAEVEEARAYEREMAGLVADLKLRVEQNDAQIEALLTDPLVNERIARRELNHRAEGEQVVRWTPQELAALRVHVPDLSSPATPVSADEPPAWAKSLGKWLPAWPWHELFVSPKNRNLLLLMSAGLLAAAFLLYSGKPVVAPPRGVVGPSPAST